ncbi:MAG: hypothetical protein GWP63_03860 [Haliea sp.]|nr:hypothetical protein [Haliea sp.]
MEVSPVGEVEAPSEAEQQVLEAICNRGVADFSGLPADSRQLRATFLEELIAGSRPDWPRLRCPLRIRGARIQGPIRALPTTREGPGMTLLFWSCHFDATVDFSGADFLSLRLVDCTLPAFIGISLSTKADLDLSGSKFSGVCEHAADLADVGNCAVHLNHAQIGGRLLLSATSNARFETGGSVRLDGARIESNLELHGALLRDCDEAALSMRSATIGGNVELLPGQGHRCEVHGEVSMTAAHITGDLDCGSALLLNPGGRALHCEDLVVESVFLARDDPEIPFQACGRLNFLTATVGGSFFVTNARLCPGPDYTGLIGKGGPVAMNLQQMRISNALIMFNVGAMEPGDEAPQVDVIKPVEGWFMLAGVQMNTLLLHVGTGWPAPGYLDIDGMSYQRVRHVDGGDPVTAGKTWLRHQFVDSQPDAATFRPQPYEQLTRVFRDSGLTREADAIAVEKIRMRLEARVDSPWLRVFPHLLMLVSHHGYSTSRAVFAFLAFVILGAVMYTAAIGIFDQPFFPFEQPPEPTTYILPIGLGTVDAPLGCPGLDTVQFALDFALPVINLGQDTFCRFVPEGPARWLWLTLHSLFAIFGAGLSAVVVLTLTGLLRRD